MTPNTLARLAGALLTPALAIGLIGLTAAPASAETTGAATTATAAAAAAATAATTATAAAAATTSDGAYYLYDSGTETRFPAGHVALFDDDLVGSASSRDARARFTCASDAETVQTFISPVGSERSRASWVAYSDSAFFFGTKDVLEPSANLSAQVLGSAGTVRARGGDYSLGLACLKFNGVQFASAGLWFTTVHVTAGSGSWTYEQAPTPLALTTGKPAITGSAVVGSTLKGAPGAWGPAPVTLSYQWNRNETPIPGASASSYTLAPADLGRAVTLTVTGRKAGYETAAATSAPTAAVLDRLTATPTPTLSGTTTVGATLTARPGTWSPAPVTLSYQWSRNGAKITGATRSTYTLAAADAQTTVTVTVTGSKSGYGTVAKTSAASAAIAKGTLATAVPTISGTTAVGQTLTAATGSWSPTNATFSYQWKRAGTAIAGATTRTYVPVAADAGKTLTVTVTGAAPGYNTASTTSTATASILNQLTATPVPTISGTAKVGQVLTARPGTWSPAPVTLSYVWKRAGTTISGATSATYTPVAADAGKALTVTVTGKKAGYLTVAKASAAVTVLAK